VTAAFVRLAVRWRGPLAAWLLFVGALSPVLGLVDVEWFVFSFLADHFQYLACIAIIVPLSAGLANVAARFSFPARASAIAGSVAVIATLTALTWRYSHAFRDNVALYGNAAVRAPGSAVAHHHLGFALARFPARRPEAIAEYEAALRINSHAAEVHEDLGAVLVEMPGRLPEAITHLETALQLKPGLKHARRTLAGAHFDAAKALAETPAGWADAISHYERAVQLDPAFAEAYFNLGNALLKDLRRRDEAIACFEHAVRIKPDFPEAHTNLGVALASIPGRLPEAIAHFEAALKANPDFTPARTNLQRVQHLLGDPDGRTR
jgi:tetratricopeptide (TPR) repeat protein